MTHHPPQPVHISHHDDRLVVNVPENLYFPEVARSLGGLRDPDSRVWHLPSRSEPLLRQHCIRLFGTTSIPTSWHSIRLQARANGPYPLPVHLLGWPVILAGEAGSLDSGHACELHPPAGRSEPGSWRPADPTGAVVQLHPGTTVTIHAFPANLTPAATRIVASSLCPFQSLSILKTYDMTSLGQDPLLGPHAPESSSEHQAHGHWPAATRHLYSLLQTGRSSPLDPSPGEPFHSWQSRFFSQLDRQSSPAP